MARVLQLRRWSCSRCASGCLAPERARKNDVRRYCLPCSTETGRLVERICGAREKRAEAKQARKKASAERKMAKAVEREKRLLEETIIASEQGLPLPWEARVRQLLADFKEWARLTAWESDLSDVTLVIRRRQREPLHWTSGHYWESQNRIVITAGTSIPHAQATLLHELGHAAADRLHRKRFGRNARRGDSLYYHGAGFRGLLLGAAKEIARRPIHVGGTTIRDVDNAVMRVMAESRGEQ